MQTGGSEPAPSCLASRFGVEQTARSSLLMLKPCKVPVIVLEVRGARATVLVRLATAVVTAVFGAALAFGAPSPAGAANPTGNGVGVYPTNIRFAKALRGGEYLETIVVLNGSSHPRAFRFVLLGHLAHWLAVVDSRDPSKSLSSVTIAPGSAAVQLRLQVPPRTADGTYAGALEVVGLPLKGAYAKGSSPVSVGVQVAVSAQVTGTEVIAGALINVNTYPAIEVGDPLPVFSLIRNSSNVVVAPVFGLRITRGRAIVYDENLPGEGIRPGSLSRLEVAWPGADTRSQVLGTYEAHLTVMFSGHRLGTRELRFQLDPYGYLHRSGRLVRLALLNQPKIGSAADVGASLVNTGAVQADSSFVGRIYRNGVLLRGVRSFQVLLLPGERGVATLIVAVTKDGLYRITGVGNFAGAQSNPLTLSFNLDTASSFPVLYPIAAAAAIVLLALALLWRRSRRSRRSFRPKLVSYASNGAPKQVRAHARGAATPEREGQVRRAHARGPHPRGAHGRRAPSQGGRVRTP